MFVFNSKHITSLLRAQPVNAIYRFGTIVYQYNYQKSRRYASLCLLLKTQRVVI
jgi:hypothetical protein